MTDERNSSPSTPRVKRYGNMSTGGRPLKKVAEYLDVEAEEDDDEEGEEDVGQNLDEYEEDFIDDSAVHESCVGFVVVATGSNARGFARSGTAIPWDTTPPPQDAGDVSDDSVEDNSDDDYVVQVHASRSPSKSKHVSSTQLNTRGFQGSSSARAKGIPSSSVVPSPVKSSGQGRLQTKLKPATTAIDMTDEEMAAFARFKAAEDKKKKTAESKAKGKQPARKAKPTPSAKPAAVAPVTRANARSAGKSAVASSSSATQDTDDAPQDTTGSSKRTSKRKHIVSDDDEETPLAPPDLSSFNAKKAEKTEPPKKKAKDSDGFSSEDGHITAKPDLTAFNANKLGESEQVRKGKTDEPVLETAHARKPRPSPTVCKVMDPKVQDPMLKPVYEQGLPNLELRSFVAWNQKRGPGMFKPSDLGTLTPEINIESLWSFLNFVAKGRFVNLARIAPDKLEATYLIMANEDKQWTLSIQGSAALCLSVAIITSSSLTSISSDNGNVGPHVPLSRHVQAQLPCQEFDRKASMCTMVFGHKVLHAQLNEDSLTISSRTVTADKLKKEGKSASASGIQSASTAYRASVYDVLPHTANIAVYDGRNVALDVYNIVDRVEDLPLYTRHNGEIEEKSCAVVCYTVTQYHYKGKEGKPDEERVNFNIQWAIVLAEPA
ncbi:hypothetical protein C8R45DRAFT_939925 [Mycena sanguinolenta]|nr:hypothetical protein C8R45DRAFT_939925 [Mycena sanguinolenta]